MTENDKAHASTCDATEITSTLLASFKIKHAYPKYTKVTEEVFGWVVV